MSNTFTIVAAAADRARLAITIVEGKGWRIESRAGWVLAPNLDAAAARIAEVQTYIDRNLRDTIADLLAVEGPEGAVEAVEQIAGDWDGTGMFPVRHCYLRAGAFIALRHRIRAPFATDPQSVAP
jgi:hypothetical protein